MFARQILRTKISFVFLRKFNIVAYSAEKIAVFRIGGIVVGIPKRQRKILISLPILCGRNPSWHRALDVLKVEETSALYLRIVSASADAILFSSALIVTYL